MPDRPQGRFQALHHQFLVSALAVKYAHDNYPQFKIGDMNISHVSYPLTCDPDNVIACQREMQMRYWFCSNVQVLGEYSYYAKRYFEDNGIWGNMDPADAEILKAGTVDFYTFSYYMSSCVTTHEAETVARNLIGGANPPTCRRADCPQRSVLEPE